MFQEREAKLEKEARRQDFNDELRLAFATKASMVEISDDLEHQLSFFKEKSVDIAERKDELNEIEDLGAQMEEALILDNKSLGYDLPMVEEGEHDPEFDAVISTVDPNGDGKQRDEVVDAFQAITEGGAKAHVTEEELYQALTREEAEYCMAWFVCGEPIF
eukprot:gene4599-5202_t